MAKSLWIKSKARKLSDKFEVRPVVLLAASLLVAFGFSVYVLYHISKKSSEKTEAPPQGNVVSDQELGRFRGLMTATGTAGMQGNTEPAKRISVDEERKEKSVVDESELTRLRSLMKSKKQ